MVHGYFMCKMHIKEGGASMAVSKAHVKASNKYNQANYKQLKANVKPEDYNMIDTFCNETGISKAQLIVKSIKYCIENGIDLK